MFKISKRNREIKYAIGDVTLKANKLKEQGKKILYLNTGDPIKYDFDVLEELKIGLCKAIENGYNFYGQSEGEVDVREAIVFKERVFNHVNIDKDFVFVSNGVSDVFLMVSSVLFENGEEILIPGPSYPIYITYPKLFGGKPIEYKCDESNNWQPDLEDIERKISDKTIAIVLINPNNPTGAIYDEKILKQIVDIAKAHNLLVIADEIYDHNVFEGEFKSIGSIIHDYPILVLNGISKSYLATGWRFGYGYIVNPDDNSREFIEAIRRILRARISPVTPIEEAAKHLFLKEPLNMTEINDKLRKRRDLMYERFNEIEGFSVVKPKGALYMFPKINFKILNKWRNDVEFVYDLLDKTGVLTVFGSGFGIYGKDHLRIVFLPNEDTINEAMDKIEKFVKSNNS